MGIYAVQWELSQSNGERFLAPGYGCVAKSLRRYSNTVLPNGTENYLGIGTVVELWFKRANNTLISVA